MRNAWVLLCLLFMATTVNALNYSDEVKNLNWNDPIEVSQDGETWYPAHFLMYYKTPRCVPVPDDENGNPQPTDCSRQSEHLRIVWHNEHPDFATFKMNHIRPSQLGDHPPPPELNDHSGKCMITPTSMTGPALRSPTDRLLNLMASADVASAMTTAANIVKDKDDLQPRIDELRRIIAEVVKCQQVKDDE